MRKAAAMLMTLMLLLAALPAALAEPTTIVPDMKYTLSDEVLSRLVKMNEEVEGVNPLSGLPASGEEYTPMAVVLDNSPEVYPHWGVEEADLFFQVPLRRDHAMRIVAVYGDRYPEQAGGSRSARMTTFPISVMFNAVDIHAGVAPVLEYDIQVNNFIDKWNYNKPIRYIDLLSDKHRERADFLDEPYNMSAHLKEIHEYLLTRKNLKFEKRYFRFADEPLTEGDDATEITFKFRQWKDVNEPKPEEKLDLGYNDTSNCSFTYTGEDGYIRNSVAGIYTERNTGDTLHFANVVVLRNQIQWEGYYCYYRQHLRYSGQAEFFMNGKHFTGAWHRDSQTSRLILLDLEGNEVPLQRGKTWFILGDDHVEVSYE
ncbi:MAG: DUF3048 C-terminal domain-containing protein [Clostridia bacterium]|nr:DUF3048 C-terminal domain-containing protein [Clostridia bacterium]